MLTKISWQSRLDVVDPSSCIPALPWWHTLWFDPVGKCEGLYLQNICECYGNLSFKDNRSTSKCIGNNIDTFKRRSGLWAWCDQGL